MTFSQSDITYMQRALSLAERARFSTDPNPAVGCVIVKGDHIVTEGWTQPAGDHHAEAYAIANCSESLEGSDVFVTLEPCSHTGKTPPCADALINAGVSRVVIANTDPNPLVAGQGIAALQQAGIKVESGLCAEEAAEINRGFFHRIKSGRPYVVLKMGMSMDAKTAMASGESQWITSLESRSEVQRLRAQSAAVITGRQTVLDDNPSMNVRSESLPEDVREYRVKQPLRVVLDSKRSLTGEERIFTLDEHSLWVSGFDSTVSTDATETSTRSFLTELDDDGHIVLDSVLEHLAELGCNQVLVESGANLAGAFVARDLVDEIHLFMAPIFLGHEARNLIKLPGMTMLSDKKNYRFISAEPIGSDVKLVFRKG